MKNKIFELYKPDSLASFLEFYKSNPKEKFVYVIQQPPPNINILSASDYGYFRKEDYLLAVGDPVIIGISTWLVGETTNGQFNMLKWDKREYRYYPLEVDGYQKG